MNLYIRIKNGEPFEHPIFEDNFKQAFPDIDLNNLPSEFRKFIRTEPPTVTIFEYTESIYTIDGNIVRDTWVVKTKSDDVIAEINEGINQQKAMILQGLKDYIQTKIDSTTGAAKYGYIHYLTKLEGYIIPDVNKPEFPQIDKFDENGNMLSNNVAGSEPNVIG